MSLENNKTGNTGLGDETQKSIERNIWMFWFPLLTTWTLMGFENPITSGLVARLPDAKENLAAFGVAFALGLIIESPIINILSAVASLCKNKTSYTVSRNFAYLLIFLVTLTHGIILIPSVFEFISLDLIGLSQSISDLTYDSVLYLFLWPPMIGIRRFYQGVMVADGRTKQIAVATTYRLVTVLGLAFYFVNFTSLSGASAGGLTLSIAVTVEALFIYFASIPSQEIFMNNEKEDGPELTTAAFATYYFPLAQTAFIGLAFQPMLTFFMVRSVNSIDALAAFPVANGFSFLFRTIGLSITEVYLVFFKKGKEYVKALKRITVKLTLVTFGTYLVIAFTPAANLILIHVLGVSEQLSGVALGAVKVFAPITAGTIILSYYRAQVMLWSKTYHLSRGTILEVVSALLFVWLFIDVLRMGGAVSAALSLVLSRAIQIAFVYLMLKREDKLA
ncbi:hypothetical protein N9W79_00315 [bacterium]|nr:hypothetical protein [bacterium]